MNVPPTPIQAKALDFIKRYGEQGLSPSYDEIARALGVASKGGVHRIVHELAAKGWITIEKHRNRCIQVVGHFGDLTRIPTHELIDLGAEIQQEIRRRGQ